MGDDVSGRNCLMDDGGVENRIYVYVGVGVVGC